MQTIPFIPVVHLLVHLVDHGMSSLKVWSKFAPTRSDGTIVKLRIQDMPPDKFDEAIDFLMEHFVKHETLHVAAGIHKNPAALLECRSFVTEMMSDPSMHITICCSDDSEDVQELLGVNSISLTTEDEEDFDMTFQTKELEKMFELMEAVHSSCDVKETQNVKVYYDDRGLAVHPKFTGLGIAREFFKVRTLICKEKGVPLTSACVTSTGSQKAAEKAGWETASIVPFATLEEKGAVLFEGAPTYIKIMFYKL
ncbi:hypothetical protein NE865_00355 [Phthorimaea operculella]|nr:hypothetical protein NE865_00355 [Phthorimaea operculella]